MKKRSESIMKRRSKCRRIVRIFTAVVLLVGICGLAPKEVSAAATTFGDEEVSYHQNTVNGSQRINQPEMTDTPQEMVMPEYTSKAIYKPQTTIMSGQKNSADECIILNRYNHKEEEETYHIGEYEIVVNYEAMSIDIYDDGDLIETMSQSSWDSGWIIGNRLYYSKDLDIFYYDFSTESTYDFMTMEEHGHYQEWEPYIEEILLYHNSYLYLKIDNGSLYDYSFIRINLKKKTQETIMEEAPTIMEPLGVYNGYMYCAYPTMDGGWYNGFARFSLGNYSQEEVIESSTSELFMYDKKIYYLEKDGRFNNTNSNLKYYDLASGIKTTLKTWKNHDMGIRKIKNGIIYLYGLQTNQEFQYNINSGTIKNVKYVAPLKGIKLSHKLIYSDNKRDIKDVCKITWDKSFEGNIEILYTTDPNIVYASDWNKKIKATKGKNYCLLNLKGGKTYYISVRTYKGKGENKVYSVESKKFKFYTREITSLVSKGYSWNYVKNGKNIYYSCKENGKYYIYKKDTKSGKQKTIMKMKKEIFLRNATNRYFYYTTAGYYSNLYVYDMKKKTKKKMNTKGSSDVVVVGGGKVICEGECCDGENIDFYCFNLDGSKRKKVGKGFFPFVYKNHIYWEQIKGYSEKTHFRYCRADMNGKNKKVVTKWIPDKEHYKIGKNVDWDAKKTYLKIRKIKKWTK